MERDISEDVKINRFKLEDAAETISKVIYYWDIKLSDQKSIVDFLESKDKRIRSNIYKEVVGKKIDGKKPTDAYIKGVMEDEIDIKESTKKINAAKKEKYLLETAVKSLDIKKKQIENLISLYTKNYYNDPKIKNSSDASAKDMKQDFRNKYKGETNEK